MLFKALKILRPNGKFVVRGDKIEWLSKDIEKPTDREIADTIKKLKMQALKLKEIEMQKREGKPYKDIWKPISFTKDDAIGVLQVKAAFELGLTETIIEFSNGTKLPMKVEEFEDFAKWFVRERNKFFIDNAI